jgi:hypothetical protein
MRFKLSTLMRSEAQSGKGFGSVRTGGDASLPPALRVGRVVWKFLRIAVKSPGNNE